MCEDKDFIHEVGFKAKKITRRIIELENDGWHFRCNYCAADNEIYICFMCGMVICERDASVHHEKNTFCCVFMCLTSGNIRCMVCNMDIRREFFSDNCLSPNFNFGEAEKRKFCLKGFVDLGGISAITCILQIVCNAEPVMDAFLSRGHLVSLCKKKNCTMCIYKHIYRQIYSEYAFNTSIPLYKLYKASSDLLRCEKFDIYAVFTYITAICGCEKSSTGLCTCPVNNIFAGEITVSMQCTKCTHTARIREAFSVVQVECENIYIVALEEFLGSINKRTALMCISCNIITPCHTIREASILPELLCVYVKRYDKGARRSKKTTKMSICKKLSFGNTKYTIYAFIEHKGNFPGAFICYILFHDEWYEFDGLRIIQDVNISFKISNAIMIFYKKIC
ncbi:ubiquitin carboxyl-terminal hydrolase 22/27/51 [Enteropsectra breve]|nr:ubiquitin carboxyl-terminal hydrolase 22/27/51 [Enteropsectra breve]